jgi:hypothetical protein
MYPIVLLIVVVSLGAGIITLQIGIPGSPCQNQSGVLRSFTIIADLDGFNNSRANHGNGPYLTVNRCDTVLINLVNNDTQAHGFVVNYYAPRGLDVQGGSSQPFRFLASKAGEYQIYCNSRCSIHSLMLHGLLTVT